MKIKTNHIVGGVLVLILLALISLNALPFGMRFSRDGFKNIKREGFQTIGSVKQARSAAANNQQVGNVAAAVPIPVNATKPMTTPQPQMAQPMPQPMPTMPQPMPTMPQPVPVTQTPPVTQPMPTMMDASGVQQGFQNMNDTQGMNYRKDMKEGFRSNYAETAGGARDTYQPIGAFDGVALASGNKVSAWKYNTPDEPLLGDAFEVGTDSLFMFKNNQCKPECCGSSFSCSGGCVCTTPDQRQYIAGRGGNRTSSDI